MFNNYYRRTRRNPSDSATIAMMIFGAAFTWYLYKNGLLPNLPTPEKDKDAPVFNQPSNGSTTTPTKKGGTPAPAGTTYGIFKELHDNPQGTTLGFYAVAQNNNGNIKVHYEGSLTNKTLTGGDQGLVGEEIRFRDAKLDKEFSPASQKVITGVGGKFSFDRPYQDDEKNGYYVYAFYTGRVTNIGPLSISIDPAVSDIATVPSINGTPPAAPPGQATFPNKPSSAATRIRDISLMDYI